MVGRLIIAGAAINRTDNNGMTALHLAAYNGHTAVLDKLMLAGADADAPVAQPPDGPAAATAGDRVAVAAAAAAAAAAGGGWLPGAVMAAGAVRLMADGALEWVGLPAEVPPEEPSEDGGCDAAADGAAAAAAVTAAAADAAADSARDTSSSSGGGDGSSGGTSSSTAPPLWPDSEVVSLQGCTALHLAAAGRQPAVVQWLLEVAGARAAATDGAGATALAVAAAAGCVECCRLLVDAACADGGADEPLQQPQQECLEATRRKEHVLQVDKLGRTALHMAALSGNMATWEFVVGAAFGPLVEPGGALDADTHAMAAEGIVASGRAEGGRTVFHYACQVCWVRDHNAHRLVLIILSSYHTTMTEA